MASAGQEIAAAFAAIQAEGEGEAARVRYRKALAAAQTIPSGTRLEDDPAAARIMAEYEAAAKALHPSEGDE